MSARSRDLPRRSCISTPAATERFLAKAPAVPADMTFFDLEDSVAPAEKIGARDKVVAAVRDLPWDDRVLGVRVNAWDSRWTYGDVIDVVGRAGERLDVVLLPKVGTAAEVVALDLLLAQVERNVGLPAGHVGIEVQIESAAGLIRVEEICAASERLEAVVFGPADFAASMEVPVLAQASGHTHYALSKLAVAARARGVQVIDGPYLAVRDLDGLRADAERVRALGFDGKMALTPDQVPVINQTFLPTPDELARAQALLDAYREAVEGGRRGAVVFDGEMIDEASRKLAIKVVGRGRRLPPAS